MSTSPRFHPPIKHNPAVKFDFKAATGIMAGMDKYYYARVAYNAYCQNRDWKSVRGEPLPQFDAQSGELKEAWRVAADAVLSEANSAITLKQR